MTEEGTLNGGHVYWVAGRARSSSGNREAMISHVKKRIKIVFLCTVRENI